MYQNIYCKRNKHQTEVHLWDDTIGYQKFQYKPYAYLKNAAGTYTSLYGDKLKKVSYWTHQDIEKGLVFESDIPVETRILVDNYGDSDEVAKNHKKLFFDIEVEVKDGFPDPYVAENKITSIALYDDIADQYSVFILSDIKNYTKNNVSVESFNTEEELVQRFYQKYIEIQPTIITGWNTDHFDIPYLYNRTQRILGSSVANALSPIGEVVWSDAKSKYKIAGVSSLDYLKLYKKFTFTEQSSYRLDAIGQLEVNIGKVEYDGTLDDLYRDDINKFIEYNLNDVVIVKALDKKLKLIELVVGVGHVSHVPYEDVFFSSRYLEGAVLVYLKKLGIIAPNKKFVNKNVITESQDSFSGAFVKDPIPGRYDWVYDLDLTSMYPSTIMTLNISPEMKIGRLHGWDIEEFMKKVPKTYSLEIDGKIKANLSTDELVEMFDKNKVTIAANGVMYRNEKKGLIPTLLAKWFDERVEYKTLMKKYGNEGNTEQYEYFNRRQHIQKIILNTFYGVMALPVFRFYDVDNAEATTTTGQALIKFTQKMTNYYYNKELKTDKDYVLYVDTDSIFCSAVPLVKHRDKNANISDNEYMTEKILSIASEVQDFLNDSYDYFALKFLNVKDEHRFNIKQEVISKSAFWVTKKRYGQWIINDGGVTCDKLDVKGLDIIRSNFPPAFRDLMTGILKDILESIDKDIIDNKILDFKKFIKQDDIVNIALPTGVKNLNKFINDKSQSFSSKNMFTSVRTGTPVHVKSAIIYNDLLKYYNLINDEPIGNGEKIKWVYLKQNPFNIKSIAFKGYNDPKPIMDFIQQYVNHDKILERALDKKLKKWYEAMQWSDPIDKQYTLEKFF